MQVYKTKKKYITYIFISFEISTTTTTRTIKNYCKKLLKQRQNKVII